MKAQEKYVNRGFSQNPLNGLRRQANIKDILIKSKIPPPTKPYPERTKKGMTHWGKQFTACPFIKYGKDIKIGENKN